MTATDTSPSSPSSGASFAEALPVIAAATVLLAGFGALLAFWLLGDWPTDRGLFDFRAATLGDALVLPLAVAILVAFVSRDASAAGENRRVALASATVGAALGATTQALWLLDDNPALNWTLPRPHHFNLPGWWHAVFLVSLSAAITGLAAVAAKEANALGPAQRQRVARSPWLAVLVWCGLTFVGLVAADNAQTAAAESATATMAALGVAGVAALLALAWTLGRALRSAVRNLAIAAAASAGTTALATVGLPMAPGLAIVFVLSAVIIGAALGEPLRHPLQAWRMAASVLVLLGAGAVAADRVSVDARLATGVLVVGATGAVLVGGARARRPFDTGVIALAVFYVLGVLSLCVWLDGRSPDSDEAGAAVGSATLFLDVLALSLIRDRFRDFMGGEQQHRRGDVDEDIESAPDTWVLLAAFALPTLAALGALLAIAGPAQGVDRNAGQGAADLGLLLGILLVAVALAWSGVAIARHQSPARQRLKLNRPSEVSGVALALVVVATALYVGAILIWLVEPLHLPLAATLGGLLVGALAVEDVLATPVRLQLAKGTWRVWLLAGCAGACFAVAVFALLSVGLWDGRQPAEALACLLAVAVLLPTAAALAAAAGVVCAWALPAAHITAQPPALNVSVQTLMYAAVALIALAVPAFVAGRMASSEADNLGLWTLANLGVVPPLIGVFAWTLINNARHARFEVGLEKPPPELVTSAQEDQQPREEQVLARALDPERKRRLLGHVRYVNWVAGTTLAGGVAWLAGLVLA